MSGFRAWFEATPVLKVDESVLFELWMLGEL